MTALYPEPYYLSLGIQGRTKWRASRASVRGAKLHVALRFRWYKRKYSISEFWFPLEKEFFRKL